MEKKLELLLNNDNNITDISLYIASGLILTFYLYYLLKSNNTANPTQNQNMEPITHDVMEAKFDEDKDITAVSNENIDKSITDSDSNTDVESDYQSKWDSESTTDFESILNDPDLFFMPNVDFDVCPIEELKFFEFSSLYQREIIEHFISDEEIMEFISWFSKEELATNWINDVFLWVITLL